MTKPLGYYGLDYTNPTIKEFAETFGDTLSNLDESSAVWLAGKVAYQSFLDGYRQQCCKDENINFNIPEGTREFVAPSDKAQEMLEKINLLSTNDKLRIVQAIMDK